MNIVSEGISDTVDHAVSVAFGDSPQNYVRLEVIYKATHVCLSMTVCMDGIELHLYGIILSSASSNSIYMASNSIYISLFSVNLIVCSFLGTVFMSSDVDFSDKLNGKRRDETIVGCKSFNIFHQTNWSYTYAIFSRFIQYFSHNSSMNLP